MTVIPNSYIEEEVKKRQKELKNLREDRESYLRDLNLLQRKREQDDKKSNLCVKGLEREDLEWDLNITEHGIQVKLKNIEELQQEGALGKSTNNTKTELETNKVVFKKAIMERNRLENLNQTKEYKPTTETGNQKPKTQKAYTQY